MANDDFDAAQAAAFVRDVLTEILAPLGMSEETVEVLESRLELARLAGGERQAPGRAERVAELRASLDRLAPGHDSALARGLGWSPSDGWSWRVEVAWAQSTSDLPMLRAAVTLSALTGFMRTLERWPASQTELDAWMSLGDALDALGVRRDLEVVGATTRALISTPCVSLLLGQDHPLHREVAPGESVRTAIVWAHQRGLGGQDEAATEVAEAWAWYRAEQRWSALRPSLSADERDDVERVRLAYDETRTALANVFSPMLRSMPVAVLELDTQAAGRLAAALGEVPGEPTLDDLPATAATLLAVEGVGVATVAQLIERLHLLMGRWREAIAAARHPEVLDAVPELAALQARVDPGFASRLRN